MNTLIFAEKLVTNVPLDVAAALSAFQVIVSGLVS